METNYRTNFFDFFDRNKLKHICDQYNVQVTSNMRGVSLISDDLQNLKTALIESFNNNVSLTVKDSVVYVNL